MKVTLSILLTILCGLNTIGQIAPSDIMILAFSARSVDKNEFGDRSDWVELMNVTDKIISIESYTLFITDKGGKKPMRFELPSRELNPMEPWIIYCDAENVYADATHTNFKLSSRGEHLALYYLNQDGELILIDDWKYKALDNSISGIRRGIYKIIRPIYFDREKK